MAKKSSTTNGTEILEQHKAASETVEHNKQQLSPMDSEYYQLFRAIDQTGDGLISLNRLRKILTDSGILPDDPRLSFGPVSDFDEEDNILIDFERFKSIVQHSRGTLIRDAITGNLTIPDFKSFTQEIRQIFDATQKNTSGHVATYIPQLGRVNPDQYAVSICTTNGQRFSFGDARVPFCIQSISKPINYCIALEEHGEEFVHNHVGREPSGIGFNGLVLNDKGLPHNPMINSGAIMCCSMVRPKLEMADRFDTVLDVWTKLSGNIRAGFNNSVYLSERLTADRNFALGYYMRENKAFPENTNLMDTLEFYFQCCSIELTNDAMAIVAGTFANAGICPTTGETIFTPDTVKNCLSLMSSCGMYDFSGEFAFTIGLPAKSGVAGGVMVVIPNIMGISIWSPRLDSLGNSVRGIEFCKELVSHFNFHQFDALTSANNSKRDPRLKRKDAFIDLTVKLCWSASEGDLEEIRRLVALGVDVNRADYDGRTALHLAASEGHANVVEYLIHKGATINPRDRWGGTPLDDAIRHSHVAVAEMLRTSGANL